jgi:hypothetical protein
MEGTADPIVMCGRFPLVQLPAVSHRFPDGCSCGSAGFIDRQLFTVDSEQLLRSPTSPAQTAVAEAVWPVQGSCPSGLPHT